MKPKVEGSQVRLFLITPIYKTTYKIARDEEGNQAKDILGNHLRVQEDKFVKETYLKKWFYKDDIRSYSEYIGSKGKKVKNRCLIYEKNNPMPFIAAHSVDEIHDAINETKGNQIGFTKR